MNSIEVFSLLLAVSLISAFTLPEQGNSTLQQRIIGGQAAESGWLPYQVAVLPSAGSRIEFCGGALISDQWILTAASCVYWSDKVTVQLGMLVRGHPAVVYEVHRRDIFTFDYNFLRHPEKRNIALLKIEHVEFSAVIGEIPIPQMFHHYNDTEAIASGWGRTSNEEDQSLALHNVTLTVIRNSLCSQHYPRININDGIICTMDDRKGICGYDIGGPLVSKSRRLLIGIASFHHGDGCGTGRPDGFTRVDYFLRWIHETITDYSYI